MAGLLACTILSASAASAVARPHHSGRAHPHSASATPRLLAAAAGAARRDDAILVTDAKALKRCLARHSAQRARCNSNRSSLQRAGSRFAAAELRLAHIAFGLSASSGHATAVSASASHNPRLAPDLRVSRQRLVWSRVDKMKRYVLVRTVASAKPLYSIVKGTATVPPPVPGTTVHYRVRTTARYSAWSNPQSISYPAPSASASKAAASVTANPKAAPAVTVSGTSLSWSPIASVSTYILQSTVSGQPAQYSEVSGTSTTPTATPGASVHYSVRTAVDGSAWSPEVAIAYPATPTASPATAPTTSAGGGQWSSGFEMGAVAGSNAVYELPWLKQLGAHTARIEATINSSVASLEPVVHAYAAAGIRPLLVAGFNARIPSVAEAENLANWAKAFGPGGTYWAGKNLPTGTEITQIEFGNETNNPYQYLGTTPANWQNEPAFLARAEEYARLLRDAQVAISQAGASVGLLGIADQYSGYTTWVNAMFKAVPDLGQRVAGWTVHPYGPNWKTPIDTLIADTAAHGAPNNVPIYATEWGLSTDNGRCLDDNFGWNKCMSYAEAASTLKQVIGEMRSRYGSRLAAVYLFQARDQQPTGASTNREYYFGALQSNQASKGAYTTEVQSLLAENP
ncbi:MAG TPA: hypothetical protein VK774_09995 [Solirubrobacteraceae bacterium]|nr:hypothetical protein [Solirubrobacteraceae bacterium]